MIILAAIGSTICILAGIGIIRITKVRQTRSVNKEMRDYVRRAY
jgi:hypothetical protein